MRRQSILIALAAATVLAAGCAQQKAPASKALNSVEESLKNIKADAERYAPEGLKGVEAQYDRLKASLDAKEYDNVLAGTPALTKAVDSLKSAVESGKEHARAASNVAKTEWTALAVEVPKMVQTIETRVTELSNKKRLPMGVNKDEFEGAKAGLTSMKSLWAEASADFKSGKRTAAVEKAKTVKGMGEQVRDSLNIKEEITAKR